MKRQREETVQKGSKRQRIDGTPEEERQEGEETGEVCK